MDPRHHHQLADLLHRQLHLAAGDKLGCKAARDDRCLGVDGLRDAELLDQPRE
jgi:hypothetical protein